MAKSAKLKIDVTRNRPSRFNPLRKFSEVIDEIEDYGMDENCFFVHLKSGFRYGPNGYGQVGTMSFDNIADAAEELERVIPDEINMEIKK